MIVASGVRGRLSLGRLGPAGVRLRRALMADVVHTSRQRLERVAGPLRHAYLEGFDEPIRFGVHGGIKKFYGVEPEEDVPATLDYMVGAVGG